MASINDFRAHVKGDWLRPSLFQLRLIFPSGLNGSTEEFSFMCNAASMPSSTVGDIAAPYMGQPVYFAGDKTYAPLDLSLRLDESMENYKQLHAWHNALSENSREGGMRNGFATNNPSSYTSTIFVDSLSKVGNNVTGTWKYYNAWPVFVSPVQFAWENANQYATCSVSFRYDYPEFLGVTE